MKRYRFLVAAAALVFVLLPVRVLAAKSQPAVITPSFDARNFPRPTTINNPYFPLVPGTVFVYQETKNGHSEHDEVFVTRDTKKILGVTCVVVRETVSIGGQVTEDTFDWYAQDKYGNVWYMGEDAKQYKNGVVDTSGSWQAGVDGALPGYIMEAHPQVGDAYRQEYYPGVAEDMAQVLSLTASVSVPYGSWQGNALQTKEWSPLEPNVIEQKYYAPGVGMVRDVTVKGPTSESVLVAVNHQ